MVVEVLPEDIPTVGTDDDPEGILEDAALPGEH